MQLWQPCQIDLPEDRKASLLVQKRSYKKISLLKKRFFLELIPWTGINNFHNTFWNFSPNAENVSLKLQKKDQKLKVLKITFFFIVFLWARKMQICLSRPNNFMRFEGKPKVFAQYPKPIKNQKILKFSLLLQKVFWTLTMQFWKAFLKIFDWSPKTFRWRSKNDKEFFEKKFSFQISYRTQRIQFSQTSREKVRPKAGKFSP